MEKRVKKPKVPQEWALEKKAARRIYWWLLLSPFLTVPCFALQVIDLYSRSSVGERVWAAMVPLIFHIPLLFVLSSGRPFVKRHVQQGLLLIALRVVMAALALNLGRYPEDGLWFFVLGNGSLWLFGSIWGLNQVKRGDCWLMRRKGEDDALPRPWALPPGERTPPEAPTTPPPIAPKPVVRPPVQKPVPPPEREISLAPQAAFERGHTLLEQGDRETAVAHFLAAFRKGAPELRRKAVDQLKQMGEVETF